MNPDIIGISRDIKGKVRRIRVWPDDSQYLHKPCEEVTDFGEGLQQNIADMFATLEFNPDGVALSANQIGVSKRLFVAHMPYQVEQPSFSPTATPEFDEVFRDDVYINPRVEVINDRQIYMWDEGCLSLPGFYEKTSRPHHILLHYQDISGNEHTRNIQGFEAFAIQHEVDHLDGKLFIDGYSRLKLDTIKRKIRKKR